MIVANTLQKLVISFMVISAQQPFSFIKLFLIKIDFTR